MCAVHRYSELGRSTCLAFPTEIFEIVQLPTPTSSEMSLADPLSWTRPGLCSSCISYSHLIGVRITLREANVMAAHSASCCIFRIPVDRGQVSLKLGEELMALIKDQLWPATAASEMANLVSRSLRAVNVRPQLRKLTSICFAVHQIIRQRKWLLLWSLGAITRAKTMRYLMNKH